MKKLITSIIYLFLIVNSNAAFAQKDRQQEDKLPLIEWQATLGINIGATSPIPTPRFIDKIYTWYPNINPSFTLTMTHHFRKAPRHGVALSVFADKRSFRATTRINGMPISLAGDKATFTGDQNTSFDGRYVGITPLYVFTTKNRKVNIYSGVYLSMLFGSKFQVKLDGDGILRDNEGNESFLQEGEIKTMSYDDLVSPIEAGLQIGTDVFLNKHLGLTFRFNAGLTRATKKEFFEITGQYLHNLYANLGVTYRL